MKWLWRWSRSRRREPDQRAEAAEHRAEELERRAEVAEESLTEFLRRRRDPWASPVISTIHGGRHVR